MKLMHSCGYLSYYEILVYTVVPMKRRRNQPDLEDLSLISRFLNQVIAISGTNQARLAGALGDISTATLSRWCRGDLVPTENDLDEIAKILQVPPTNFKALRLIENTGRKRPMLASAGAYGYLAEGAEKYTILAGLSMVAGITHLRVVNLKDKTVLLQLLNPLSPEAEHLDITFAWLTTFSILKAGVRSGTIGRVRLWIRDSMAIDEHREVGEIAGNDWLVIESGQPGKKIPFRIRMRGDKVWDSFTAPFIKHLAEDDVGKRDKLLWDSAWEDASRLAYLEKEFLPRLADLASKSLTAFSQDKR